MPDKIKCLYTQLRRRKSDGGNKLRTKKGDMKKQENKVKKTRNMNQSRKTTSNKQGDFQQESLSSSQELRLNCNGTTKHSYVFPLLNYVSTKFLYIYNLSPMYTKS